VINEMEHESVHFGGADRGQPLKILLVAIQEKLPQPVFAVNEYDRTTYARSG
jgi:hypothetical protein